MSSIDAGTWVLMAVTTVPFLALEVAFFVQFGRWLRNRDRGR